MQNMKFRREMPAARVVREMYPLSEGMAAQKRQNDMQVQRILTGESGKFLLVIGPCSADREDAVLEYLSRLRSVEEQVREKLVIVPRLYTLKPRTTGDGYKGMLHQPDPSRSPDLLKGLLSIRRMHTGVLEKTGFSCADEMLYPEYYQYLSDCLSYAAIGARSVEDQLHRFTASGLDIPVGMKNPTGGDLNVMMNAIHAAQRSHTFPYAGWEVVSGGNPLAHAILRGYSGQDGSSIPNYHYEDLMRLCELYARSDLYNPAVIVDTNHCNSGKRCLEQPRIAGEVLHSMRHSGDIRRLVKGLMVESYLVDGSQSPTGTVFGQSITDPCLGWEKTERMIFELAEQL